MATATMDTREEVVDRACPEGMNLDEWRVRCDLAAAYQLVDLYGMSDLAGTHISARVPGPHDHFLLNPMGTLFTQITASSLIKVDVEGKLVEGREEDWKYVNPVGFVIHSAVHMARPDLTCALHTHTRANNGVGGVSEGLLPITQKALTIMSVVRYHDYESPAANDDDRVRIVRDLGDEGRAMILRNHGALTVGKTIAEAWTWNYRLEMACRHQVDIMAGVGAGLTMNTLSDAVIEKTIAQGKRALLEGGFMAAGMEWPSLLRKLERERGTSYRT